MGNEPNVADLPKAWRATSKAAGSTPVAVTLNVCAGELEADLSQQSPSYEALDIIARSVASALERAGVTECDDPGEAIDVLREGYERTIARLSDALNAENGPTLMGEPVLPQPEQQDVPGAAPTVEDAHAMGVTGGVVPDAERVAFEAWMKGHCWWPIGVAWVDGGYRSSIENVGSVCPQAMMVRRLWAAWRDRAALAARQPVGQAEDAATAPGILQMASSAIADRAAVRDQPAGERSMARTVAAFNAITGHALSERDGWLFMVNLKAARACGGAHHSDDYVDGAAYFALAGESAIREVAK